MELVDIVKDVGKNEIEERPKLSEVVLLSADVELPTYMKGSASENEAVRTRVGLELTNEPVIRDPKSEMTHLQLRFFKR